ncbi:hypothetical protein [Agrobacterium fabrum]|uniref:hypothetical protein n=1 Tax=Agrobacterium fabrum TaxID=1176649 RepID=UPI0024748ED5|nr:hypothetical protein [Agrobacterium fabrum]MDH6298796.1 hypothetical protein [Agrobacterium fabrum]
MADIEKKPAKLLDSKYKSHVLQNLENILVLAESKVKANAESRIGRYSRDDKVRRYKKDLDLFDRIKPGTRDTVIRSRPWGWSNKKLLIDKDGAFIRQRGRFRKTRKILSRDAESHPVVGFEKESFRKKTTESYDQGRLLSKNVIRKDGSYEENWELSKGGELIRTRYQTSRIRDGGLFRSISQNLSPADSNGFRTLTSKKDGLFKKEDVFETDENGKNLRPIGRKNRIFSKYSQISENRDFANVDIRHFGGLWSKSYSARLDAGANVISKDIGERRKLLSKRSLHYEEGELQNQVHTFGGGKLYKHSVDFKAGDGLKTIKKKIFGVTIYKDTVNLSAPEVAAHALRKNEALEHKDLWEAEVARREAASKEPALEEAARDSTIRARPVPAPGTTIRLGATPALHTPKRDRSPFASGVVFPKGPEPSLPLRGSKATEADMVESKPLEPSHHEPFEVGRAADPALDDNDEEELAFLKGAASPTPRMSDSRTADALPDHWKPVARGDGAEKTPPVSPTNPASKSGDDPLDSWKPLTRGRDADKETLGSSTNTASKSSDDLLDSWKPLVRGRDADKETPASRDGSVTRERTELNSRGPSGTSRSRRDHTDGLDAASMRGLEPRTHGSASLADW